MKTKTAKTREWVMQGVFTACACISILAVALICVFLFANGLPTIFKIGPLNFLLGSTWKPGNDIYGILPMILGSIYVTAGAIIVGVPIGLLTAVYMSKFASPAVNKVMLPAVQLLAGIPSVVYGFFGMVVMVPAVQAMVKSDFFKDVLGVKSGKGMSLFTAALLLGIMILPTIITVSKASLDAVPESYYEGSLALGATHERSVFCTILPAAKSGVLSAVILGIGRAIGETMAVVMVAGNQTWMPQGLFQGLRTMTSNIVIEMGYAADLHREALIATGVVLFVFILLINVSFSLVKEREKNA
ncbi:phosphate ABC transporter permease subunit PstC [uncultured Gemmiger sp.]|uniref:phosphate ABC transporter permease subunit PstC n=1 Tax=uncultured Gemmiger sp. TaxID=1623490 RepID=UPI002666A18B|nr:phosphate ABC transporter permease subunit PstC [uncultured Gemmiger sp.]